MKLTDMTTTYIERPPVLCDQYSNSHRSSLTTDSTGLILKETCNGGLHATRGLNTIQYSLPCIKTAMVEPVYKDHPRRCKVVHKNRYNLLIQIICHTGSLDTPELQASCTETTFPT